MFALEMDSLFPKATSFDVAKTKKWLKDYKKTEIDLAATPDTVVNDEIQNIKRLLKNIEIAVNLILDEEIRNIVRYRYIEGNPRKAAVIKFPLFTDRTLDRKVKEGIVSVANTLKLWGEI